MKKWLARGTPTLEQDMLCEFRAQSNKDYFESNLKLCLF